MLIKRQEWVIDIGGCVFLAEHILWQIIPPTELASNNNSLSVHMAWFYKFKPICLLFLLALADLVDFKVVISKIQFFVWDHARGLGGSNTWSGKREVAFIISIWETFKIIARFCAVYSLVQITCLFYMQSTWWKQPEEPSCLVLCCYTSLCYLK